MSCPRCGYCPECGRSSTPEPVSPWVTYPLCYQCGSYHNQWTPCPYKQKYWTYEGPQVSVTFQEQVNRLLKKEEEK